MTSTSLNSYTCQLCKFYPSVMILLPLDTGIAKEILMLSPNSKGIVFFSK